jgi:flagellar basal body-associated protein FliL
VGRGACSSSTSCRYQSWLSAANVTGPADGTICPWPLPFVVDPCGRRAVAASVPQVYSQFFCPSEFTTKVQFDVREANQRLFTLRVLPNESSIENYVQCGNTFQSVAAIEHVPCTGLQTFYATNNLLLIFECEDAAGCSFYVDFTGSCSYYGVDEVLVLSYVGLVLGAILVLFGLGLIVANFALRLLMKKLVVAMSIMAAVLGGATLAQWATMLRALGLDTSVWTTMLQVATAFSLCSSAAHTLLILIQLCLMFQWVYAHYRAQPKTDPNVLRRVKLVFVLLSVLALLLLGAALGMIIWPVRNGGFSAAAASDDSRTLAQVIVVGIQLSMEIISATVFVVYAGLLIKASSGAEKRATTTKLLFILIVVIATALTSLAFFTYFLMMSNADLPVKFLLPPFLAVSSVPLGIAGLFFVYLTTPIPVTVILSVLASNLAERRSAASTLDGDLVRSGSRPLLSDADYQDKYDL